MSSCTITEDGSFYAWGRNSWDRLATGNDKNVITLFRFQDKKI